MGRTRSIGARLARESASRLASLLGASGVARGSDGFASVLARRRERHLLHHRSRARRFAPAPAVRESAAASSALLGRGFFARGINTKSPLEDELEQQREIEAREAARRELASDAEAIAAGAAAAKTSREKANLAAPPPRPPAFGAPIGTGVGRPPPKSVPAHEKPKPKRTVVKAPTLGIAMHSDQRSGPAGNRNLMPEPPERKEEPETSQAHLRDILRDGSFERFGVGGLDAEFLTIFRRVFASRMVDPAVVRALGMRHVKGMLLYGPPGTGKTLVAKQLGKLLNAHPPKIVNGPEILQRFVGQSEENMRDLFAPAEKEFKGKGDKSKLHVIIFDEIDAIMKARGSGGAAASVVHDNVVNQLLTKLDGMQSLDNVLVVGITNRRDLLDPAVLRPGRLELQVEVGLPDLVGRAQIFNIHTAAMRREGLLGECVDLDALAAETKNYSGAEIKGLVGAAQSHALARHLNESDEEEARKGASEDGTEGSSNDDASRPFTTRVTMSDFAAGLDEVRPAMGADDEALAALRPLGTLCSCTTGASERSPHKRARDAIGPLLRAVAESAGVRGSSEKDAAASASSAAAAASAGDPLSHLAVLVHGVPGAGTSAAVAEAASIPDAGGLFPHVRVLRGDAVVAAGGPGHDGAADALRAAFDDASKANLSLLILDDLDVMLGIAPGDAGVTGAQGTSSYVGGISGGVVGYGGFGYGEGGGGSSAYSSSGGASSSGGGASSSGGASETLRTLRALLRRPPPPGRRLAVVATTSSPRAMRLLGLRGAFHAEVEVPALSRVEAENVLAASGHFGEDDGEKAAEFLSNRTPVKPLLRAVQLARALTGGEERKYGLDPVGDAWTTALARVGLTKG